MDLTAFSKYEEIQSEIKAEFKLPLNTGSHENDDLHLIGDSLPSPSITPKYDSIGAGSVGASPFPAREDHVHGSYGKSGITSVSLNSSGFGYLVFPSQFTGVPILHAQAVATSANETTCSIANITSSQATIRVFVGGTIQVSQNKTIHWSTAGDFA